MGEIFLREEQSKIKGIYPLNSHLTMNNGSSYIL